MAVKIKAKKIKRGHSIPALDNAYVVDVDVREFTTDITFHDTEGEEGTLIIGNKQRVEVDQAEPRWVG